MNTVPHALEVSERADREIDEIATFIARDSYQAATRFYDAVEATYTNIRLAPMRWPVYPTGNASLPELRKRSIIGYSNFLIFYAVDGDVVKIYSVISGMRDIIKVLVEEA